MKHLTYLTKKLGLLYREYEKLDFENQSGVSGHNILTEIAQIRFELAHQQQPTQSSVVSHNGEAKK